MNAIKTYLCLSLFMVFNLSFAQYTEVINSNRPGVSKSAFSVGTNVVQFEVGPYYIKEQHTPLQYDVSGLGADFSARYGLLFEQLELNVEGIFQRDKLTDNRSTIPQDYTRSNFKQLTVGAKYLVYDPYKNADDKPNLYSYHANHSFKWKSLIPAVAVYAGANFDTKNNPYTDVGIEGFSPKLMIATQNNFSGGWVLVTNLIKDRIGTDQSDFSWLITLTHSFSPQWVVFGETQGISSDFYADNLFRFGGAYLWTRDFQIDTAVTFNTKDTPSVFGVNLGFSYRLDFHKDKDIDNGNSVEEEKARRVRGQSGKKEKQTDFDDGSLLD